MPGRLSGLPEIKQQSQYLNPDGQDCRFRVLNQSARPQKEARMESWGPRMCESWSDQCYINNGISLSSVPASIKMTDLKKK